MISTSDDTAVKECNVHVYHAVSMTIGLNQEHRVTMYYVGIHSVLYQLIAICT